MPLEKLSPEALNIIYTLTSIIVGLILYFFKGLKSDVSGIKSELTLLIKRDVKLVHKNECHQNIERFESKINEIDTIQDNHSERISRLEERQEVLRAKL